MLLYNNKRSNNPSFTIIMPNNFIQNVIIAFTLISKAISDKIYA